MWRGALVFTFLYLIRICVFFGFELVFALYWIYHFLLWVLLPVFSERPALHY